MGGRPVGCWGVECKLGRGCISVRAVGDVLLHETAISWLRREEESSRPLKPWEETPAELSRRIQLCVSRINRDFDVRGLCMEFPGRLDTLAKTTYGDRLPK